LPSFNEIVQPTGNVFEPRFDMTFDRRARVLIADADPGLRHSLNKRLLDAEVFADSVADGKMALEALAASSYAVVILDLALPQLNSERVLDAIAAMPANTRPVVLVLAGRSTARSLDVDVVQIVLRKPCNLVQLSEIIQSCVKSAAESRREGRPGEGPLPLQPLA
jgi:DNA-binding NtrC family response regulator